MGARPYLVHGYECFVSSLYLSYLTFSLHTYVLCFQGIQRRAAELLVLAASRSNVMSIVDRVLSHVAANITRYLFGHTSTSEFSLLLLTKKDIQDELSTCFILSLPF